MQTHIHSHTHTRTQLQHLKMHMQGNTLKKTPESISQTCTVIVGIVHVHPGGRPAKITIIVVKKQRGIRRNSVE